MVQLPVAWNTLQISSIYISIIIIIFIIIIIIIISHF